MASIKEIMEAVEGGKAKVVGGLVQEALDNGEDPAVILNDGFIAAMTEIGEKFKNNEIFVPEMLVAARAMKKGLEVLKPCLSSEDTPNLGKYVIGTVEGDLHDIGKNLVCIMVESVGFEIVDLGVDVKAEQFIEAVQDPEVKVVGLSALLTTTMPNLKATVEELNKLPNRSQFKIMVGGAPITPGFAEECGADAYTADAAQCAEVAKSFVA